jgi:hypothetical protein
MVFVISTLVLAYSDRVSGETKGGGH